VLGRLTYGNVPAQLRTEIVNAVTSISIVHSNPASVQELRRLRVNTALLLVTVSPEFQVQR
jgi:hypothetical protein